jgi:type III secretion protein N (ATPase)
MSLAQASATVDAAGRYQARGRVSEAVGLLIRATAPAIRLGELVEIERPPLPPLAAEVSGFRGDEALLLPLGEAQGIGPSCRVRFLGHALCIRCGEPLLGRVLDGLGRPLDGPAPEGLVPWEVDRPAPDPLRRPRVSEPLPTGIRALDALCPLGQGQRLGLFSGPGVGKSTLLGQIARQTACDVAVVCLVGERGREVREFLDTCLGDQGRRRSVVVVATADAPSLVRLRSAFVATAIAEQFRDQGRKVLLLVDSLTRLARAQREVALACGEPPARQGYPPSVFALLPRLLERAGNSERGSITAVYTVLVAGSDMDEPIADEARGILDGHIVLGQTLAERGHFPAIDVLGSLSRLMPEVTTPAQQQAAQALRRLLADYEQHRDLILLGAYARGSDPRIDEAIHRIADIERFLCQGTREAVAWEETVARLLCEFGT